MLLKRTYNAAAIILIMAGYFLKGKVVVMFCLPADTHNENILCCSIKTFSLQQRLGVGGKDKDGIDSS